MSPELINEQYQLSSPATASSHESSTTVLFSLVLVQILRLVIASFVGGNNKRWIPDGVEPRKNAEDLRDKDRVHNFEVFKGINTSMVAINNLDDNSGPFVYGESRGFWNALSLPRTIPEVILALQFFRTFFTLLTDVVNLVLNKYRLDMDTIEELNKSEDMTIQNKYPQKNSRALRIVKPNIKSNHNNKAVSSEYLTTFS